MKKKIICAILALVMIIGCVGVLASCNEDDPCTTHVDEDGDKKCDKCGAKVEDGPVAHKHKDQSPKDGKCDVCGKNMTNTDADEDQSDKFYWDEVDLIIQMTNHQGGGQLSSTCARYLAGEYDGTEDDIDIAVDERNDAAAEYAKIGELKYAYYPNTDQYDWGEASEVIMTETSSTDTTNLPDVYVNYIYDMVAASLQGCFANLYGTVRGENNNFFPFLEYRDAVDEGTFDESDTGDHNEGYFYEYMTTLTLSKQKMYLLASDYFTDLVRAFYVVPVNVKLLEELGKNSTLCPDLVGDDGVYTLDDFYQEVYNHGWNYDRLAELSAAVYKDDDAKGNPGSKDLADTIGFAINSQGGLSSSGILYSTACTIIEREWNSQIKDWEYDYPETNDKLFDFFAALDDLMDKPGVMAVKGTAAEKALLQAGSGMECVEKSFSINKILFGGVLMVGGLENNAFQQMKEGDGFGIVPVPLYSSEIDDPYLTQIHNVGRIGAISFKTTKFEQCTAYFDYLSRNSDGILEDYYKYKLQYGVLGEDAGTIDMMNFIRNNVRSAFDKTFEDAMGVFNQKENERWHNYLHSQNFQVPEFRQIYNQLIDSKKASLANLVIYYNQLDD